MNNVDLSESLHRLVKQAIDSGEASTVDEAKALFAGYKIAFSISPQVASDPAHQAALLTGVALARRVFLGGVSVIGAVNTPVQLELSLGSTLSEAAAALGATLAPTVSNLPIVTIGGGPIEPQHEFHVRAVMSGWRGGVVRADSVGFVRQSPAIPLSAAMAAAIAVSEAFQRIGGKSCVAGRQSVGLSLWNPSSTSNWLDPDPNEPELKFLPSRLWIIGLGHLGQAFLWALGILPYPKPANTELVLQDVDHITPSTESTGILTDLAMVGARKTRPLAEWAEQRGFTTSIHERIFDSGFRRQESEPQIAFCGIDNALGRRALDTAGFGLVIEAGLGRGYQDYCTMRIHTLPGPKSATSLWTSDNSDIDTSGAKAYHAMLERGDLDKCGITLLANKAVGAPFVGTIAACLSISEILRLLHGGTLHNVIELDLRSIEQRAAIAKKEPIPIVNPGFIVIP